MNNLKKLVCDLYLFPWDMVLGVKILFQELQTF